MTKPIVIVPGIMGTRLVNGRGRSIWDPDEGISVDNVVGLRSLFDVASPALPNPQAAPAVEPILRAGGVVNGGHLVWGLGYSNLVTMLSGPAMAERCGEPIKIYCAGYDWRQSNLLSAQAVVRVIERALRETGAEQVVLVCHSMGGLVARIISKFARIHRSPASARIARLILLGSPIHGAPKAYRALRQSLAAADGDADSVLSDIDLVAAPDEQPNEFFAGAGGRFLARLVRRLPSAFELLPTADFCAAHPNWVRFDSRRAGLADASDPVRLYGNALAGVNGSASLLRARQVLDARLGNYLPSQAIVMYSSELATEVNFRIVRSGLLESAGAASSNLGDGTVPAFSGRGAASRRPIVLRQDLHRINHSGLANDPVAVRHIANHIAASCRQSHSRIA